MSPNLNTQSRPLQPPSSVAANQRPVGNVTVGDFDLRDTLGATVRELCAGISGRTDRLAILMGANLAKTLLT